LRSEQCKKLTNISSHIRFNPYTVNPNLILSLVEILELKFGAVWEKFSLPRGLRDWLDPIAWVDTLETWRESRQLIPSTWSRVLLAAKRPAVVRALIDGEKLTEENFCEIGINKDLLSDFTTAAIFRKTDNGEYIPMIRLTRLFGEWFISDPACDLSEDAVYIGRDSIRLARRTILFSRGTVLDAYAGTGIQGILANRRGARVIFAELNPRAIAMCRINLFLAGITNGKIIELDSFEGIRSRFDLILANPPYGAESVSTRPLALSHSGGIHGDEETFRILDSLSRLLKPDGRALIVGTYLFEDNAPHIFLSQTDLDLTFEAEREDIELRNNLKQRFFGVLTASHGTGRRRYIRTYMLRRIAEKISRVIRIGVMQVNME